jgi:hypothetical protein
MAGQNGAEIALFLPARDDAQALEVVRHLAPRSRSEMVAGLSANGKLSSFRRKINQGIYRHHLKQRETNRKGGARGSRERRENLGHTVSAEDVIGCVLSLRRCMNHKPSIIAILARLRIVGLVQEFVRR